MARFLAVVAVLAAPVAFHAVRAFRRRAPQASIPVSIYVGLLALAGFAATLTGLVATAAVFDSRQTPTTGVPGGWAYVSHVLPTMSVNGLWNADGRFVPAPDAAPHAKGWPIQWGLHQSWNAKITQSGKAAIERPIHLYGYVSIPPDASLADSTVHGELRFNVTYPSLVGSSSFRTLTDSSSIPFEFRVAHRRLWSGLVSDIVGTATSQQAYVLWLGFTGIGVALLLVSYRIKSRTLRGMRAAFNKRTASWNSLSPGSGR